MNFVLDSGVNGARALFGGAKVPNSSSQPNPTSQLVGPDRQLALPAPEPQLRLPAPTSPLRISGPNPNSVRLTAPIQEVYEPFLPDSFYKKRLPTQVSPGVMYLHKYNVNGDIVQTKFYDSYGREKGWVDYTTHNQPGHTNPHSHQRIYNQYTPNEGYKINYRMDPSFPMWLGD